MAAGPMGPVTGAGGGAGGARVARQGGTPAAGEAPARRHDLDALRVLATLGVFLFHVARVFDSEPWHVKNDVFPLSMDILVTFMNLWQMPLLFLLAGASSFYALRARPARAYVAERCRRLLIPFVWGVLLLIPPQVYVERIGTSPHRQSPINFQGSFLEFYPHFFTEGVYPHGNLTWNHLWFIIYLFVFSLLLLPLFLYLQAGGRSLVGRLAAGLSRGRAVLWLALPVMIIDVALAGMFPGPQDFVHDLANVLRSMTYVLYGYLLVADPRLQGAAYRNGPIALATALVCGGALAALLLTYAWPPAYTGLYVVVRAVWALCSWALILTLLWLGHRHLNAGGPALRHASQIAYPFYLFHQTVIVVVAYFVVPWRAPVGAKYLAIGAVSFLVTWSLSEAVKLTRLTRHMFGVKPARPPAAPLAGAAPGA